MRWDVVSGTFRVYEKGGDGGGTSTTVTQNFSPEEAAQRAKVQEEAARIYAQSAGQIAGAPYPGAKPSPFSQESIHAQNALTNYALGPGQQTASQAGGFSSFLMGPAQYAESNPYLQSAMSAAIRPINQAYTDPGGVLSSIRGSAMGAGGYGTSTRQGIAEGVAGRGYLSTIGDVTSKMASENYQNSMKLGAQALALAPQTYDLGTRPALDISSVGTQKETMAQSMEDYAANQRMWDLNAPWAPLQNYANIVFGGSNPGTTSTSSGGGGSNRQVSALGSAATGAAVGSAFGPWGTVIGAAGGLLLGGLL